jgi:hypothetical protein
MYMENIDFFALACHTTAGLVLFQKRANTARKEG